MTEHLSKVSSTTSNATTATGMAGIPGLSSLSSNLTGPLNSLTSKAQSTLDSVLPQSRREDLKEKLMKFATERPKLATFLLSQIALSGLPLALFIIMSLTVVIFALITGILIGVLGALVFIVLALGFALFILLPTLFVTTFFAVAVWLWGLGAYYIIKRFNDKKVPGLHIPMGEGLKKELGLDNGKHETNGGSERDMNGHAAEDRKHAAEQVSNGQVPAAKPAKANHHVQHHHSDDKENQGQQHAVKSPPPKKKMVKDESRTRSKTPTPTLTKPSLNDTGGAVTDVGKGVTGVVS